MHAQYRNILRNDHQRRIKNGRVDNRNYSDCSASHLSCSNKFARKQTKRHEDKPNMNECVRYSSLSLNTEIEIVNQKLNQIQIRAQFDQTFSQL